MSKYLEFNKENKILSWGNLTKGILIKRYKRFLADIKLESGELITAHTANTGKMTNCSEPGAFVWLSKHENAKRKYQYSWEIIQMPSSLVGINTSVPNKLIYYFCKYSLIPELNKNYKVLKEVKYNNSRLDLKLIPQNGLDIYIEIKNCTLAENNTAKFPDAETKRGQKHLDELIDVVKSGSRALLFILVQRTDVKFFSPNDKIDPIWGEKLRKALKNGVEILAYSSKIDLNGISLGNKLEIKL